MNTTSPGQLPAVGADPEALIKEARRRQHRRYLMAGLATAVMLAVLAVTIASVTVGKPPAGHQASGTGPIASGLSAHVASGQIPPYYVAITSRGNPNAAPAYAPFAVVRATATGATLATIKPSVPRGMIAAVTAAADDRTFVLDETPWALGGNTEYAPRTFYLLRLSADGHVQSLSRLPMSVPGGQMMTGLALSPDGSKLAMAVISGFNDNKVEVRVYTLASGAVRTWYGNGVISIGIGADDAGSLSWAADKADARVRLVWKQSGSVAPQPGRTRQQPAGQQPPGRALGRQSAAHAADLPA